MAQIVAAMAMTHSPGLTGWFDRAPMTQQLLAKKAMDEMRWRLEASKPDVILGFSNDHLLNWPINNIPEFTVGIGEEHVGPADWYDEWLGMPTKYRIPGYAQLARYIVNEGARRRVAFSFLREMQFDDGFSVPMHYLNPYNAIPLVPISPTHERPAVNAAPPCQGVGFGTVCCCWRYIRCVRDARLTELDVLSADTHAASSSGVSSSSTGTASALGAGADLRSETAISAPSTSRPVST